MKFEFLHSFQQKKNHWICKKKIPKFCNIAQKKADSNAFFLTRLKHLYFVLHHLFIKRTSPLKFNVRLTHWTFKTQVPINPFKDKYSKLLISRNLWTMNMICFFFLSVVARRIINRNNPNIWWYVFLNAAMISIVRYVFHIYIYIYCKFLIVNFHIEGGVLFIL